MVDKWYQINTHTLIEREEIVIKENAEKEIKGRR